jgi:transporter family protein
MMLSVVMTLIYVVMLPFMVWLIKFDRHLNATGLIFAVLGALAMGLGSLTYFYALQKGDAGLTTAICATYPSLTLVLSGLFLGEHITAKKVLGLVIIVVGSMIMIRK